MRKLSALVAVLLVGGSALANEPFTSAEGRFTLTLPQKPEASTQPLAVGNMNLTMHLFTIEFPDSAILVSYLDYPNSGGMTQVQRITATVDAEVKGQHGTIVGKVATCDVKQILCRELAYKEKVGTVDAVKTMRNYLDGKRLYQVAMLTTTALKPELVKTMFDSFTITH